MKVQLFKAGHVFEGSERLELVLYRLEHLNISVALPAFVHLLQLVVGNIQVLERREHEVAKLADLVILEIEVLELG